MRIFFFCYVHSTGIKRVSKKRKQQQYHQQNQRHGWNQSPSFYENKFRIINFHFIARIFGWLLGFVSNFLCLGFGLEISFNTFSDFMLGFRKVLQFLLKTSKYFLLQKLCTPSLKMYTLRIKLCPLVFNLFDSQINKTN